jgi:hypothetical protein
MINIMTLLSHGLTKKGPPNKTPPQACGGGFRSGRLIFGFLRKNAIEASFASQLFFFFASEASISLLNFFSRPPANLAYVRFGEAKKKISEASLRLA